MGNYKWIDSGSWIYVSLYWMVPFTQSRFLDRSFPKPTLSLSLIPLVRPSHNISRMRGHGAWGMPTVGPMSDRDGRMGYHLRARKDRSSPFECRK